MNRNLKHNYRVTECEDVIIRKKAQIAQMKLSDYVRHAALEKQIVVRFFNGGTERTPHSLEEFVKSIVSGFVFYFIDRIGSAYFMYQKNVLG